PAVPAITLDELRGKVERGDPFHLFEVLPLGYWRKHHLPGAKSLPPDRVEELAPQLAPDRSVEIVLYCWDDG
ncbi:MAG TPA: rhodanese-like domain-containing protein, partial [Gemmatimonadaceae bacterium]|nr:rhodanese-like domain-containing protein [Gemmatimonadaceae bacterium]